MSRTVIWLYGLPCSGKTTLGETLVRWLTSENCRAVYIDGDEVRRGMNNDLDFSKEDRRENIRRIAELAHLLVQKDFIVVVGAITPHENMRRLARRIINTNGRGHFFEVYLSTPLHVCEKRDVKGMYKQARQGGIPGFTGISGYFQEPLHPDIVIDTSQESIAECIQKIMQEAGLFCLNEFF